MIYLRHTLSLVCMFFAFDVVAGVRGSCIYYYFGWWLFSVFGLCIFAIGDGFVGFVLSVCSRFGLFYYFFAKFACRCGSLLGVCVLCFGFCVPRLAVGFGREEIVRCRFFAYVYVFSFLSLFSIVH